MRRFGFSTGALAKGDFRSARACAEVDKSDAIEYSALREDELESLTGYLFEHGTGCYRHVAFHAPSYFKPENEGEIVGLLRRLVEKLGVLIIAHPDAITRFDLWRQLGSHLCIENMDHRKPIGRSADELDVVFRELPEARLCFDIGHAHEMDRSMSLGYEIVRRFGDRIAQIHASEVSDDCEHRPFSASSEVAFARISRMLPATAAVILETVVQPSGAHEQMMKARAIFEEESLNEK